MRYVASPKLSCIEGAFEFADVELEFGLFGPRRSVPGRTQREFPVAPGFGGFVLFGGEGDGGFGGNFVGDGDDFHLLGVGADEFELVDHGVELVVVGAEGLEDFPDDFVDFVVVEGFGGVQAGGNDDGEDDVAAFFAGGVAHDASDGLDDIDLGVAGGEEEDGVEAGHVDAFGEAADVGEDAAGVGGRVGFEPGEFGVFLGGVHGAVDVFGFADEGVFELGLVVVVGFDDGLEHGGDFFGADAVGPGFAGAGFDDLAEGDGAAHGVGGVFDFAADAVFAEGLPAADDAGGVVDFELVVVVGEEFLEAVADVLAVDGEDDDFVVGEEAEVDGFGEGDDVELFPEEVGVVHGAEGDVVAFGGGLGEGVVDARGGGHVEAPDGAEEVGVVDADEVAFGLVVEGGAGGAVGFVADDEVEGGGGRGGAGLR